MTLSIITADITTLRVDAIVNAANPSLLGGGGVDGAIHRAAGPALLAACRRLPESAPGVRCRTGEARITAGFALPARYVIHTVGPVWHGGGQQERSLLEQCHRNALRLLRDHDLSTIAFPAISCGVYRYPIARAAAVAIATLRDELAHGAPLDITVCCFSEGARAAFQRALDGAPLDEPPFNAA